MTQNTKTIVQLSAGFFVAIILHAVLTATLNRVPLPGIDLPKQAAVESFSFDTVESAISSPQRVNAAARDEVKKQICIPCRVPQLPIAQITPKPPTVQSSQQNIKQYNLDLFIGNDYESQALQRWFNESKELVEFKGRCNFQIYTSNNALYKARYASIVPESQFPAILFTKKDGGHIYVAGKAQLPPDAATLYSDIGKAGSCFNRSNPLAENLAQPYQLLTSSPKIALMARVRLTMDLASLYSRGEMEEHHLYFLIEFPPSQSKCLDFL
jgi:hypothetical protein